MVPEIIAKALALLLFCRGQRMSVQHVTAHRATEMDRICDADFARQNMRPTGPRDIRAFTRNG